MKKISQFLIFLLTVVSFVACNQPMKDKTDMNKPEAVDKSVAMKARYQILIDAFDSGKPEAVDTLVADNSVDHSEDTSMHLPKGKEGLKQMIVMMHEASPDMKTDIKALVVEGDMLIAYGTMKGTNSGPMMGMPATNKSWSADFADVIKFNDNMKMSEHWGVYDQFKMMRDLGMIPPPPPADKKSMKM